MTSILCDTASDDCFNQLANKTLRIEVVHHCFRVACTCYCDITGKWLDKILRNLKYSGRALNFSAHKLSLISVFCKIAGVRLILALKKKKKRFDRALTCMHHKSTCFIVEVSETPHIVVQGYWQNR